MSRSPRWLGRQGWKVGATALAGIVFAVSLVVSTSAQTPGDPTAVDDTATTAEDTAVNINVLANDTDPDAGTTLTVSAVGTAVHGTVVINADHTVRYTPAANYHGPDSFTYTASDGSLTDTATVDITVTPVNDAPVAVDDTATTNEGVAVNINVLANDTDVDTGATLSVSAAGTPLHGTVVVNADNTVRYTPAAGYSGPDVFAYTVSDGALTDTGSVSVTVRATNVAPVAVDDTASTSEDVAVNINVLADDTDADAGDTLDVTAVGAAAHGAVVINTDNTVRYTPAANYNGPDSFTYTVSDGALSDSGTVNVTVTAVNDAPVAVNDTATTTQNTAVTIDVTANDSDVDNAKSSLLVSLNTAPSHGTLTFGTDRKVTYTPAAGFAGTDTFSYRLSDGSLSATATVTVTVRASTAAPSDRVTAACQAYTGSDQGILTLCRVYLSGQLPAWAQEAVGKVVLKRLPPPPKPTRDERVMAACTATTDSVVLRLCAIYTDDATPQWLQKNVGKLILRLANQAVADRDDDDKKDRDRREDRDDDDDDDDRRRIRLSDSERKQWEAFWQERLDRKHRDRSDDDDDRRAVEVRNEDDDDDRDERRRQEEKERKRQQKERKQEDQRDQRASSDARPVANNAGDDSDDDRRDRDERKEKKDKQDKRDRRGGDDDRRGGRGRD